MCALFWILFLMLIIRFFAVIISASSAEFTTDFVPVLSMTKLADGASGIAAGGAPGGGHTCFADILIPGEVCPLESVGTR